MGSQDTAQIRRYSIERNSRLAGPGFITTLAALAPSNARSILILMLIEDPHVVIEHRGGQDRARLNIIPIVLDVTEGTGIPLVVVEALRPAGLLEFTLFVDVEDAGLNQLCQLAQCMWQPQHTSAAPLPAYQSTTAMVRASLFTLTVTDFPRSGENNSMSSLGESYGIVLA